MVPDSYALEQLCPACGSAVDVTAEEPLARVACPACGAKFRVERAFDNFVLVETVGVGGMGSVYKARDGRLDRFVALKLLRKELSADPREAVRLEQEARLTASISHPHVGQVFSSGSDHGQFYLVMELMEHGSLDDLIAQHGRVPESSVLEAGIQVAQGLQAALEKGLIHRDVKPANILFADAHTAKIVDFGLAVAAEQNSDAPGEIWGTPYYVAPERLNNEPEDFRSDIYSLGATMFHALAGRPPIEGETNSAAVLRELKNRPMNLTAAAPGVSRPTARLIQRMLNPNAARRFSSYRELIAQMQRVHRTLVGRRAPTSEQQGRTRALVTALAVLAVVVVCLGAYVYQSRVRQPVTGLTAKGAAPPVSAATVKLKEEENALARQLDDREKAESQTRSVATTKALEKETPVVTAALIAYRKRVAAYDFEGAARAVAAAPRISEAGLKQTLAEVQKKAAWLVGWKNQLIADLRRAGFTAPLADVLGTRYNGITGADQRRLILKLRSGSTAVGWQKFAPETLLAVSSAFIQPGARGAADRQWLCAVFAQETNQSAAARMLGEAAASAKPVYREQLRVLTTKAKPAG